MSYNQATADLICDRLAEGESLRSICRDGNMPGASTVFEWLEAEQEFRSKYARARKVQAELMADELLEIADDGQNDWMERYDRDGKNIGWQENGEALRRSQLRIATRQWVASKLLPKKYGERLELAGDPDAPFVMDTTSRAARLKALLEVANARKAADAEE